MDQSREFVLQDVRCFHGVQRAQLRPITLLVGENSTGKTTFLGCYGVLHQLLSGRGFPNDRGDFNMEPFSMGSFRDIVRSKRGPGGRIDNFKLGLKIKPGSGTGLPPYFMQITFSEEGSQPVVSSVRYEFDSESFLDLRRDGPKGMVLTIPDGEARVGFSLDGWIFVLNYLSSDRGEKYREESADVRRIADYLSGLSSSRKKKANRHGLGNWIQDLPQLIPVAPLRSKPKRTYDPIRETTSPDGEHIPMMMMRLDRTDKSGWGALHGDLVEFGRDSGLFSDIRVRRHGRQMSDPFQLQVKVRSGSRANIMDVGYGISQSLPILVDVCTETECAFLLQQPEVHLHPRAQAELARLFVESFKKHGNQFLVETHSDYIIDRVRILVRNLLVDAGDVSILYFEPKGSAVKIHSLTLDKDGNLVNAPKGYRDFFVNESDRLLGFTD